MKERQVRRVPLCNATNPFEPGMGKSMSSDMDMQEIFGIFFEECGEGLDVMESGLLGLDLGAADLEVVNDIFRAAHSIKGGAATFGFLDVSDFTHHVETLLDELRSGERSANKEIVDVLLESVDCLRGILASMSAGDDVDMAPASGVQARISHILASAAVPPADSTDPQGPMEQWKIRFEPQIGVLQSGNDPLRIFNELRNLGALQVECHDDKLPPLSELDPTECRLRWTLTLDTACGKEAIENVFGWVSDECKLDIQLVPRPSQGGMPAAGRAGKESSSIRVATEKVDTLLNLVGELVITQSMLKRCGENYSEDTVTDLRDGLMELERYTRELQESAMQIRMLPINVSFSRFPRLVRDMSSKMGKKVKLQFSGENTELDKNVLEKMSDPLVHLVRNALDHGIESPEDRIAAGKDEIGVLHLSASHEGGNIVIRVIDDGKGIDQERILELAIARGLVDADENLSDEQINHLIFHPGFSTADTISDVSGRGVGMDVVRNNIKELGGRLEVRSEAGKGSVFTVCLPLTLAILDGQLVSVADDTYVFPVLSIVETVQVSSREVNDILNAGQVYRTREHYIPVVRLRDVFNLGPAPDDQNELLVIVESDGRSMGIFVDELLEQQQVVIKSLEENYQKIDGLAGATILGDGRVALIIDVPGLMQKLIEANELADPDRVVAA